MILILVICAVATGLYFLYSNYQYWEKRGVPGPKPVFIVGNLTYMGTFTSTNFPNAPIVGIFRATTPVLLIRDPDLIKDITVKSFSSFHNNDWFFDKDVDPLTGRNPFFLKDEEWNTTRGRLTPAFSRAKLKSMYPLLEEVSKNLVTYIAKQPGPHKAKELCMRFTLNNVGSCAFGLEAKCFEEDNPEFMQIANRFLTPEGWQNVKIFFVNILPALSKLLKIRFTPIDVEEKLTDIVRQTLDYRQKNNIVRNDFLHIMHQLTKSNPSFDETDVTASAAGFFADGYETSSVVMHFILFELAAKPEAQSKLRDEIEEAFRENGGSLPFEKLQQLPYLDATFKEALRLHPPLGSLNKVCTKVYTYLPTSDSVIKKPVVVEEDTRVIVPLYGLQRDPKYFDNPDSFEPERFLDTEREIQKYAYLPFGEGPRKCLGQRFGTVQVKIGISYIVKNYIFSVNRKTKLPIKYDPMYFLTLPKDAIWLDFEKI